jgi:hypothetical protein
MNGRCPGSTLVLLPHSLPEPGTPAWRVRAFRVLADLVERVPGLTVAVFESPGELHAAVRELPELEVPVLVHGASVHDAAARRGLLLTSREGAVGRPALLRGARTLVVVRLPLLRCSWWTLPAGRTAHPVAGLDLPRSVEAFRGILLPFLEEVTHQPRLLVVLDPRLVSRPYGRCFLRGLLDLRRTRELDDALAHLGVPLGVTP